MKHFSIEFVRVAIGVFLGLIVVFLLAIPLSLLPELPARWITLIALILAIYIGLLISTYRMQDLISLIYSNLYPTSERIFKAASASDFGQVLLDASAILDGRVSDIGKAGWVRGLLLVPRFVVMTIENKANSDDNTQRLRGKYGLEVLEGMQRERRLSVKLIDSDLGEELEIDNKLILLAKRLHAKILTADAQLTRSARLQGISVMNVDELAVSAHPVFLPNERDFPQGPDVHIHF